MTTATTPPGTPRTPGTPGTPRTPISKGQQPLINLPSPARAGCRPGSSTDVSVVSIQKPSPVAVSQAGSSTDVSVVSIQKPSPVAVSQAGSSSAPPKTPPQQHSRKSPPDVRQKNQQNDRLRKQGKHMKESLANLNGNITEILLRLNPCAVKRQEALKRIDKINEIITNILTAEYSADVESLPPEMLHTILSNLTNKSMPALIGKRDEHVARIADLLANLIYTIAALNSSCKQLNRQFNELEETRSSGTDESIDAAETLLRPGMANFQKRLDHALQLLNVLKDIANGAVKRFSERLEMLEMNEFQKHLDSALQNCKPNEANNSPKTISALPEFQY